MYSALQVGWQRPMSLAVANKYVNSQLCEHAKMAVVAYHTIEFTYSYNSSLGHGPLPTNLQSTVHMPIGDVCLCMRMTMHVPLTALTNYYSVMVA
jgi:hypothetical protein